MKLGKFFKSILDILPFNGHKLDLGAIMVLIGGLGGFGIDPLVVLKDIAANPTGPGVALVIVGLAHKILKSKYGSAK